MSLTSVDLPEPETPVTETKQPSGNETSTSLRLFSRAPWTVSSRPLVRRAAYGGHGDRLAAGEVEAGLGVAVLEQLLDGAGVDDLAAVLAGAGPDVDDPVGGLDGVLVVLDDDQGVAEVLEPDLRVSISRWLSRWCRPMLGSSRT